MNLIKENIDLYQFNTFGLHAAARYFTAIRTVAELKSLIHLSEWTMHPKFILGGGSNILLTKDYEGLVVKNEIKGIDRVAEDDHQVMLKVGAGENWHDFVLYCINQSYGGVENLSFIPGTVGAAPIQNIGAYGVELKDIFCELEAVRLTDGVVDIFKHEDCQFGYRDSVFKSKYKNQYTIVTVTLRLQKKPIFNTHYDALGSFLEKTQTQPLTLKAISDAVIHIRQSKLPDPKLIGNAGSFFKNPLISTEHFLKLQHSYSTIPHFPDAADLVKIPAGWLIEQCGWKGKRLGEVGVYDKQALVLVNFGKGTGLAIHDLALQIQASVYDRFQIHLTPEVNII